LIVMFSDRVYRDREQSTSPIVNPQLQKVVKGILRYDNCQLGMRKTLDMNYFMYYIQDLEEDMTESNYMDNELIQ